AHHREPGVRRSRAGDGPAVGTTVCRPRCHPAGHRIGHHRTTRRPGGPEKDRPVPGGGAGEAGGPGPSLTGLTRLGRPGRADAERYWMWMPEMARLMTSRWISEVPSKM